MLENKLSARGPQTLKWKRLDILSFLMFLEMTGSAPSQPFFYRPTVSLKETIRNERLGTATKLCIPRSSSSDSTGDVDIFDFCWEVLTRAVEANQTCPMFGAFPHFLVIFTSILVAFASTRPKGGGRGSSSQASQAGSRKGSDSCGILAEKRLFVWWRSGSLPKRKHMKTLNENSTEVARLRSRQVLVVIGVLSSVIGPTASFLWPRRPQLVPAVAETAEAIESTEKTRLACWPNWAQQFFEFGEGWWKEEISIGISGSTAGILASRWEVERLKVAECDTSGDTFLLMKSEEALSLQSGRRLRQCFCILLPLLSYLILGIFLFLDLAKEGERVTSGGMASEIGRRGGSGSQVLT